MSQGVIRTFVSAGKGWSLRTGLVALCLGLIMAVVSPAGGMAVTLDEKIVLKFVGKNWVNGRSWEKLDYAGKLGFVCGLFDGITLFYSAAETRGRDGLDGVYRNLSVPADLTVGDVVKGVDEFYQDGENQDLPAVCGYLYVTSKTRGEPSESMKRRIRLWRRLFHE